MRIGNFTLDLDVISKIRLIVGILITSIIIVNIFSSYSFSAVFDVTTEEELRQALDTAASNGEDDLISIAAGLYSTLGEPFAFESDEDFSLTIEGEGAGLTILGGGGMSRVLDISTASQADIVITIKGLTIQNGFHVSIPGDISNPNGAGIYIYALSRNVVSIEDCEFINNSISRAGHGGGLYASAQNINLSGNLFSGNSAAWSGGGAYISASGLKLLMNEFYSNSTELGDGAGAYIHSDRVVSASITNNIFISNVSSSNGGGLGASACCFNIEYVITNNTFTLNTADENGGGISFSAVLGDIPPPPAPQSFFLDLYNNIVFDNFAVGNGDDLFVIQDSFPGRDLDINLFNNDFSDSFITCENLQACLPDLNEGDNIDEDPLFVDAESGDVSLQADSSCIDAGDPNAPDAPDTDIFGNQRVPPPDMGAVEFIPPVVDLHGDGGGCSIAHSPVASSLAVFLPLPVLILIRRIVRRHRI